MMLATVLLFPLIAAGLMLVFPSRRFERAMLVSHALLSFASVVYWWITGPEEFIGYFRSDEGNLMFLGLIAILYLAIVPASLHYLDHHEVSGGWHRIYAVAMVLFVFAMTGAVLATNIGLFWVFVEATTLASAPFIYFERGESSLEAAWKYVFICSVGIAIAFIGLLFLALSAKGVSLLFYDELLKNAPRLNRFWLLFAFPFLLVGFGTKAGIAPMHSWLPDAHSEAPAPVSAFLSGMLLNSAFYGLFRIFRILEEAGLRYEASTLFLVCGMASLLIGAIYISGATNYKRLLAYSSIENMGIILVGVALGGMAAFAAMLHLAAHALTKGALFITSGNIAVRFGSKEIAEISGLAEVDRPTAVLWGLGFVAIAGLPPFPLFFSEMLMAQEMILQQRFGILITFLALITLVLYGMVRAVSRMYAGTPSQAIVTGHARSLDCGPQAVLIFILAMIGIAFPAVFRGIIANAGF